MEDITNADYTQKKKEVVQTLKYKISVNTMIFMLKMIHYC